MSQTTVDSTATKKTIGYLEAVVRIPLIEGDEIGSTGPGDWWEYACPGITKDYNIGVCNRKVTEHSRRLLDVNGQEVSADKLPNISVR